MTLGSIHFGDFTFDPGERLLTRGSERLELGSRYANITHDRIILSQCHDSCFEPLNSP